MIEQHFRLKRRPFAAVSESPIHYPATGQEAALTALLEGVRGQEAFALLTGEAGTGKTVVAQRLLGTVSGERVTAWIANTHCSSCAALFQGILYDLGEPYQGQTEQELRLHLTELVLTSSKRGQTTLLVIDEAHHLTPRLLEELRLLSNLETRQLRALQIILTGQPSLGTTLRNPELRSLAQRIPVRAKLAGLDLHEAVDYLVHHLRASGGRPEQIITDEALEVLARGAAGIPRLLNHACHRAMQLACLGEQKQVDAEAAFEALSDLGIGDDASIAATEGETPLPRLKLAANEPAKRPA